MNIEQQIAEGLACHARELRTVAGAILGEFPFEPQEDWVCHNGIVPMKDCAHCTRVRVLRGYALKITKDLGT